MRKSIYWLFGILALALGGLIHYYLEDEIYGGIIKWLRKTTGITEASVLANIGTYIVPLVASVVVLLIGYLYGRQGSPIPQSPSAPIEILFDQTNPNKKFWSLEQQKDKDGNPIPGAYWEYRAAIRNSSNKTLRHVKVTVEATGPMPSRPEHSRFDINKQPLIDLAPKQEALAVIRLWYHPILVQGMVCGPDMYGPIQMTAHADDVLPTTKSFHFDPMRTPMIWE